MSPPVRVLFVCTGNICRSPSAEGIARSLAAKRGLAQRFEFDSAGTHGYHVGEAPDPRSIRHAARRGYDLLPLRARQLIATDFENFDWLLGLDHGHLRIMRRDCPPAHQHKLRLALDFSPRLAGTDVPDPYYGDAADFEAVLDLLEEGCSKLLDQLAPPR